MICLFFVWYTNACAYYGMTYLPSDGTSLSLNGERLVSVPGAEFARTYFGIWLKPNDPLSKDLRRNLVKDLAAN